MKAYSYVTGPDDASLCHRVTEQLSRGWKLYGSPALTYDVETKRVICEQVVVKDVPGTDYVPSMDRSIGALNSRTEDFEGVALW